MCDIFKLCVGQVCSRGEVALLGAAQVELFCISKLINCLLDADEEFVYMDCHFAVGALHLAYGARMPGGTLCHSWPV